MKNWCLMSQVLHKTFVFSTSFWGKIDELFHLENASSLPHKFFYDNFNKQILLNFLCQIWCIFKTKGGGQKLSFYHTFNSEIWSPVLLKIEWAMKELPGLIMLFFLFFFCTWMKIKHLIYLNKICDTESNLSVILPILIF